MLKIVALCLCSAIILVSGNDSSPTQAVPESSSPAATLIPNAPAEPTEKTTKPPVTTQPPTPSTTTSTTTVKPAPTPEPPKTTTVAPVTTSPSPTPDNTTTTTVKPTPGPSPNVTTTPSPVTTTHAPAPKDGTWIVNGANKTCIVVRMSATFNVTYLTKDNKTQHKVLSLPTEKTATNVTGNCGDAEQTLNITWHAGNDSFNIHFVKNETTKRYSMHHVELNLGSHEFPDAASNETLKFIHEADLFPTGLTKSYKCMKVQKLDLTRTGVNGTVGSIEVSDVQFQAFKTDKTSNFGDAQDCVADVPDVVPIAVGCALTALVIIILAAYLIGRRRSQARGYLSM